MNLATAPNRWATALKRFLGEYLPQQRAFSPHTILSYRDTWKLLLRFAAGRKRRVADLTVADLSPTTITAFLHHLETVRGNGAATRNVRLSAIHSFFEFFGAQHPEHLAQAQRVLSVPLPNATRQRLASKGKLRTEADRRVRRTHMKSSLGEDLLLETVLLLSYWNASNTMSKSTGAGRSETGIPPFTAKGLQLFVFWPAGRCSCNIVSLGMDRC